MKKYFQTTIHYSIRICTAILLCVLSVSCQKVLKMNYGNAPIKQVIIANLSPGSKLYVNISKSKQPDDYSSVDFLMNCQVDLYEDSIYKETMPFILRDTLSGLGYYVSSSTLKAGKTYRIVSSNAELGTAEATEYLPAYPRVTNVSLLEHADSSHPTAIGKYLLTFQDSAQISNYYYFSTFYRILKPRINDAGDTVYVYDHIYNLPSHTAEFPNPTDYNRTYFTDQTFNGQEKTFLVDFPSQYNNIYKEIYLLVELSNTGKNFYNWNVQQLPVGQDFLNEGQEDRRNLSSNIINGYGHFTANSSTYITIRIK